MTAIPDGFGARWRQAIAKERPRSAVAHALAWELLDLAYMQGSTEVLTSRRVLQGATDIGDGRTFSRASEWLVERGLLEVRSTGIGQRARTIYALMLPAGMVAPTRPFEGPATTGGTVAPMVAGTVAPMVAGMVAPTRPLLQVQVQDPSSIARERAREAAEDPDDELELDASRAALSPNGAADAADPKGAVSEEQELDRLLAPLERGRGPLTGSGRLLCEQAFADEPDGFASLARSIASGTTAKDARSVLVAAVRGGEHRQAAELAKRSRKRRAVCPECGLSSPHHVHDCPLAPAADGLLA